MDSSFALPFSHICNDFNFPFVVYFNPLYYNMKYSRI